MPNKVEFRSRSVALAVVLVLSCLWVGWLAVRFAALQLLPPGQAALAQIAPNDPNRILDQAMSDFVVKRGKLTDADYASVARAAAAAPLDARPYMLVAARHILSNDGTSVVQLLEAGRRLDPRQRWIRLYLLDQYLRTRRYADASMEYAVLARLVGGASAPIATELARMSTDPATAEGVRQTLARDPGLENIVLAELAKTGASPKLILGMASPVGMVMAAKPDGWGPVLVNVLVAKRDYREARAAWRRIYAVSADPAQTPYDGAVRGLPGAAPFNWTLFANEIGATDRSDEGMSINYYGRQPGELANQLLTLAPGDYRLTFIIAGAAPSNGAPTLSWTIGCNQQESPLLLNGAIPAASGTPRSGVLAFTVPPENCGGQWLRLMGSPGQFPATLTATVRQIAVQQAKANP